MGRKQPLILKVHKDIQGLTPLLGKYKDVRPSPYGPQVPGITSNVKKLPEIERFHEPPERNVFTKPVRPLTVPPTGGPADISYLKNKLGFVISSEHEVLTACRHKLQETSVPPKLSGWQKTRHKLLKKSMKQERKQKKSLATKEILASRFTPSAPSPRKGTDGSNKALMLLETQDSDTGLSGPDLSRALSVDITSRTRKVTKDVISYRNEGALEVMDDKEKKRKESQRRLSKLLNSVKRKVTILKLFDPKQVQRTIFNLSKVSDEPIPMKDTVKEKKPKSPFPVRKPRLERRRESRKPVPVIEDEDDEDLEKTKGNIIYHDKDLLAKAMELKDSSKKAKTGHSKKYQRSFNTQFDREAMLKQVTEKAQQTSKYVQKLTDFLDAKAEEDLMLARAIREKLKQENLEAIRALNAKRRDTMKRLSRMVKVRGLIRESKAEK